MANDPIGERFGCLVVLAKAESHRQPSGQVKRCVTCQCDCGHVTIVTLSNLRSGHTTSCGCVQSAAGHGNATHGCTGTQAYRAWQDMIQRCYNPSRPRYPSYGGRGITVCERWRSSFEAFITDMGEPPTTRHSIDRVDNDKGYFKENCRWATNKEQSRNTTRNIMVTYSGKTKCLSEWAEDIGMPVATLYYRFKAGWPPEKMLWEPTRRRK